MIRGIQRKMIMVKTDKSSIFESACFLLRTDAPALVRSENDMLKEANRIIEENYSRRKRKKETGESNIKSRISTFLCGGLAGMLLIGIVWLISALR